MTPFVDGHAHLSMPAFAGDLDAVIARARDAGVERIMTCATSLGDARRNTEIAAANVTRGLLGSVGFHPHEARHWDDRSDAALRGLIADNAVIAAIGEVGLDFHYDLSPRGVQEDVLRRQIGIARDLDLPLIIHCRNARESLAAILKDERAGEVGGMLHCFTEDAGFARLCLDTGLYVSFSGIVTFPRSEIIREAARIVPLDRLLVETDAPYLAPAPRRGGRNEPARVVDVGRFIADLKGVSVEALGSAVTANFSRLFDRRRAA